MHKAWAKHLLGSAAAIVAASPALAQDASTAAESRVAAPSPAFEDIVVTAQRREERAQTVPIVISAFSAERLKQLNVTQAQDLYGVVPSLVVGNQGQNSREAQTYAIRGQSQGFLSSPAVAIYLNEVPLPAAVTLSLQGSPGLMVDLANVQVLSGPQGTLFGRNTTGGAVLYEPKKPTGRLEGYVEGTIGNYDLRGIEGVINIPVIEDKLMIRAVAAYRDRRGFTKDLVWDKWRDDVHWYSGRLGIMMRPTERLENYTMIYGAKSSTNGSGYIHRQWNLAGLARSGLCSNTPATPAQSCAVYARQTEIAGANGPRRNRGDVDGFSRIENWGITNTTALELSDELTLRNIFSYQKLKDDYAGDQDGTPLQQYGQNQNALLPDFPIPGLTDEFGLPATPGNAYLNGGLGLSGPRDDIKQLTEELQVQGKLLDNHLTFTAGAFYFDVKPAGIWSGSAVQYCSAAATGQTSCRPSNSLSGVSNLSKALYGQGSLDFGAFAPALEGLRLTAGYRYTWDRIKGFQTSWTPNADGTTATCRLNGITPVSTLPIGDVDQCNFSAKLKSNAPTWTFGLDYRPSANLMLYAKVSRGYKSGGFNTLAVRAEQQTFQPERLTTYEGGFKSNWSLGGTALLFNATYFYSDYSNIQRPTGDRNPITGVAGAQILGAKARIQGVEVEASARPARWLEIGGNLSFTDADYKKFEVVTPFGALACNGIIAPGGLADYSCRPFQFVTRWIYNLHASIDLPVSDALGDVSLYVNYSHFSKQATAPLGDAVVEPGSVLEPYGLLNASLNWKNIASSGIDAGLFANNLTNKLYRVSNSNVYGSQNVWSSLYGEPRTFGLKLRYSFGAR